MKTNGMANDSEVMSGVYESVISRELPMMWPM